MAIGDAVAIIIGTAATNRQPSAGVEEQITAIVKHGTTDAPVMYDGTTSLNIVHGSLLASTPYNDTDGVRSYISNMAIMISNAVYIRKEGTADTIYFGGIQTAV